ncbi:carbohydrate ABC transporter permease [Anaerolineales bacterium HSG6]|nr:carbohydrate ABC transporter permease [Anaerolineales bacterium HSG6]MDM8531081.1 carbohydrate ABC transporter permease [Anaerolineales bacterium HSG25]
MTTSTKAESSKIKPFRILIYLVLIIASFFYILPMYLILATSFKQYSDINLYTMWELPPIFFLDSCTNPYIFCFDSFYEAWFGSEAVIGMGQAFMNSVFLTLPGTFISTFLGSLNGYILSKWKFKYADVIFPLILFGMFIPYQAILIPLTITLREIGLYASIPGLVLVHVVYSIPIATLIFRNYYASIPNEMLEAARIDGGNIATIYQHIILPLSPPAFVVVLIWQFTAIWNDFLFAVTIVQNEYQPMTVALNNIAGSFVVEWNVQMAAAFLTALPPLLVYVILGRYFVQGLLAGSLKG